VRISPDVGRELSNCTGAISRRREVAGKGRTVTRLGRGDEPGGDESASADSTVPGAVSQDRLTGEAAGIDVQTRDVRVSAVGWVPNPDMDERRWIEYGKRIGRAGNGTSWWIGDWLRYGSRKFGEKYALAARVTGYDVQTLMNYAYVAEHVPISDRRPDVSWSHHAELAKLDRQVRAEWLKRAAHDRLSVKDLRLMLRTNAGGSDTSVSGPAEAPHGVSRCPACGRPLPQARHRGGGVSGATADAKSGSDT
jgi:hypothetical protein